MARVVIPDEGAAGRRSEGLLQEIARTLLLFILVCGTSWADDAAWLRRAALDVTGRLPTADQLSRARAKPGPATRAALAGELLSGPTWAKRWGKLLAQPLIAGDRDYATLARRVEDFVTGALEQRLSWDRIARELLTAEGSVDEAPATAFLLQFIEARADVASRVGTGLMGVRLACAQCHDHPFARWTVADFHGLAACFSRTRRMEVPRELYQIYREGRRADLKHVDIALPRDVTPEKLQAQLKRVGESFAVLNRHAIGAPPRPRNLEMEVRRRDETMMPTTRVTDLTKTVPVLIEEGTNELSRPDLPELPGTLTVTLPVTRRTVEPRLPGKGPLPKGAASSRAALAEWMVGAERGGLAHALANRITAHLFVRPLVEPVDGLDAASDPRLDALAIAVTRLNFDVSAIIKMMILSDGYLQAGATRPLDANQIAGALESGLGLADTAGIARALSRQARERADDASGEGHDSATPLDLPAALMWVASPELDNALGRSTLLKNTERLPADRRLEALMLTLLARSPSAEERARFAGARPTDAAWALIASAEFLNH